MSENTKIGNNEYNLLKAIGREADFLHETIDEYKRDAQNENRNDLVELWEKIKKDKQNHVIMLKEKLEEFYKQKYTKTFFIFFYFNLLYIS
jgi:rubrerythrin